jgi:Predicted membrane protein
MDATSRIAAKYRFLFRPPGSRLAPALIFVTSALTGVLLEGGIPTPTGLAVWLLSLGIGPIAVNLILSRSVFGKSVVATGRRLNMMTLLENYFLLAGAAVGELLAFATSSRGLAYSAFLASLSLSAYVRATVLSTFDGKRWKGLFAGFAGSLVRVTVGLTREELAMPSLLYVLWGLSLSTVCVGLLSLGPDGLSPIRLAAGFVGVILGGKAEALERELRPFMERRDFRSTAVLFRCPSGRRIALILTGFHFGPFRNVGSSMMNYLIELELSKRGIDGLVVKGCSGHGADVFDGDEVRRVASELAEALGGHSGVAEAAPLKLLPQREVQGVKVMGFEAGRLTFVIPTLNPEPMEDLPPELEEQFAGRGVRVIDPHNSYADGYDEVGEQELRRIRAAVEDLLGSEGVSGPVRVALVRKIPEVYGPHEGIGPSGLSLLGIAVGGRRMAIAVVDGNNALPHVRSAVVRVLREGGWDYAELLTTDTHAVNGVTLGGRGYRPVGEVVDATEVAEAFAQLSSKALEVMEDAEVSVIELVHRDVPVLGEGLMERLAALMRRSITVYLLLMFLSAAVPLIVS